MPTHSEPPIITIQPTRTSMPEGGYVVLCSERGIHALASLTVFSKRTDAQAYQSTVAPSRNPVILSTDDIHRLIVSWKPSRESNAWRLNNRVQPQGEQP